MEKQYKYTVCIHCMTYNHKPYILDALNGFAMQHTDFPFVAIVMDDASTDGEPEVLHQYISEQCDVASITTKDDELYELVEVNAKDNPNCHFAFYFLKENQYRTGKKQPIVAEWDAQAKYIAMCEGDDYWTDPYKLQRQVDYLEAHNEYIMCANRTIWLLKNGTKTIYSCAYMEDVDLSTEEIVRGGGLYINYASIIHRNGILNRRDYNWWKMADVGDYPLYIAASLAGKVRFFADEMSVYRSQCKGSWTEKYGSGNLKHIHNEINWLSIFDEETNFKYHTAIQIHLFPNFWRALYRMDQLSLHQYIKVYKEAKRPISILWMVKDIIRHYLKFLRR